jgi:predicted nucleotidyltransferase
MTIKELKNQGCILMECVSGSRAYNLHTETSDTDIKGVYILPKNQYFGLNYIPQISNKTNDVVYYTTSLTFTSSTFNLFDVHDCVISHFINYIRF